VSRHDATHINAELAHHVAGRNSGDLNIIPGIGRHRLHTLRPDTLNISTCACAHG
jgi:hypothetical protein